LFSRNKEGAWTEDSIMILREEAHASKNRLEALLPPHEKALSTLTHSLIYNFIDLFRKVAHLAVTRAITTPYF
jgi:hypothetical protein